tara:strand:+ start:12737 stop:16927 length:4191 start_codon:yes stop_codon:yes gene_type:complete
MKTKFLFRYVIKSAAYLFVFIWTIVSANAQCPTTIPTPPTICDAAGYTFADLSADYATDTGGGIVWYNAISGGTRFFSNQLVSEGTYYADQSSGACSGSRASTVIDFQVNKSGQNLDRFYCSNENATFQTYKNDVLVASIPPGGNVEIYYDPDLTNAANTTDLIPLGVADYYVVFVDSGLCRSQIEIGRIGVFQSPPDPTPASTQEFCIDANPTVGSIDPGTTATVKWFQGVDGFGNPIPPALLLSTPLVDGSTYYVQIDELLCDSNAVPVTVTINNPFDPGISGTLEYCQDSVPISDFDLFPELGGTPDTNGAWSGPLPTSGGHLGTVNISTLTTPGVYTFTYTVPANGACPESSSDVTITIFETFSSGVALTPAIFCESGLPSSFDLFSLLDGTQDPNGQWTQGTLSTDPVVTSPIDLSTFTANTYNFTYTQNLSPSPCAEESTTVQVIILQDPNAGIAVNQTFCENDLTGNSPFNLFNALDGSQDNNSGIWTDSNANTISNSINITGFTVAGSPYTFNYTIDNGTCSDTEPITITIAPAPESGTALAPFEVCEENTTANSPFDLFTLLDGTQDTNGTWYVGTDTSGSTITNPIDISGFADGTYNYTYSVPAIGTCTDVDVTVQIIVNPQPNTGTPTAVVLCENDLAANSPLDLFGQLSGNDPAGTWTDDNTTGALTGSNVNLTLLPIGSYNFTYSITSLKGCSNSSTVVVTVNKAPESGTPVTTFPEYCIATISTGQTVNLFDLLNDEDQTGTWADINTPSIGAALSGNLVTLDGLSAGTYNFTYDVAAIGTCDDVDVTVSIIINDAATPTGVTSQEFCNSATVSDLSAIGTTIQWYDDATGGTALAGSVVLVNGETYYATQIDAISGCESSIRFEVTAIIYQSPNAGNPNATPIIACSGNNNIDLNTGLDGTQDLGGVWQDTDGTGALTGNSFDGTAVTAGTYQFRYYVAASAPCADDFTDITVTIEDPLNAGTDGPPLDICSDYGTVNLFGLLGGTPDAGGTWSPALTSGTGVFDPLVDFSGTYTYTLINACGTFTSKIDVTVTLAPNAGVDNSVLICVIDGPTDLFTFLGTDAQPGGTWSPALPSGTGVFDPLVDASGIYTYTVTAVSPCATDSSAQITVTVDDSPAPIIVNANPIFCASDNPTVADLNMSITAAGTVMWYTDTTLTTVLSPTDVLIDGEDYFATQTNSSGCESSQNVQLIVTVNDVATPTLINPNLELCINDDPTVMELTLNISEYNSIADNVIWYDSPTGGSTISNSSLLSYGVTYYAVLFDAVTGCESSIRLAVVPDVTSCGRVALPDGFSPNGDGVNDTYDYNNLDILYPNFEMEIYNRYGNIVYKGRANSPRFNGTSNQARTVVKGDLPVGVYFYIFKFNDGENKPEQGRLYLSR